MCINLRMLDLAAVIVECVSPRGEFGEFVI